MDHFRIQCFMSVAEHASISKAAAELFVTQPAVTAQIKKLEKELGVELFIRDARSMRLTAEGIHARELLSAYLEYADEVQAKLDELRAVSHERLAIGFHGPANWGNLATLIDIFSELNPSVHIHLVQDRWNTLLDMVNSYSLDVAFVVSNELEKRGGLDSCELYRDGLCVALPTSHPLAKRKTAAVSQFENDTVVTVSPHLMPTYLKRCDRQMTRSGLSAKRGCTGNTFESTLTLVEAGRGIAFIPRSFKTASNLLSYVDLDNDGVSIGISLAWRKANPNTALSRFLVLCEEQNWEDRLNPAL